MKIVKGHERVTTFEELKEMITFKEVMEVLEIINEQDIQRSNNEVVNGIPYQNWCDKTKTNGFYKLDTNKKEIKFLVNGSLFTLIYNDKEIMWL